MLSSTLIYSFWTSCVLFDVNTEKVTCFAVAYTRKSYQRLCNNWSWLDIHGSDRKQHRQQMKGNVRWHTHEMYTQLMCQYYTYRQRCRHANRHMYTNTDRHFSHLGGFDFVASTAGPASQVRQDLTPLSVHTWMHLAPPLLGYDGGWVEVQGKEKDSRLWNGYCDMRKARMGWHL